MKISSIIKLKRPRVTLGIVLGDPGSRLYCRDADEQLALTIGNSGIKKSNTAAYPGLAAFLGYALVPRSKKSYTFQVTAPQPQALGSLASQSP